MLAITLMAVLSGPAEPEGCTIEGRIKLLSGDKEISPAGLAVVYVESSTPPLPPATDTQEHTIRQNNKQFSPRVVVINQNDTVSFINEEKVLHSVFSRADFDPFDFPASSKGRTGQRAFIVTGPMMIQCDRHRGMRADVLVLENRHWVQPGADGRFRLTGLPAGRYTLTVWEPNLATAEIRVKSCKGIVDTGTTRLVVGPEPDRVRKDGSHKWIEYDD